MGREKKSPHFLIEKEDKGKKAFRGCFVKKVKKKKGGRLSYKIHREKKKRNAKNIRSFVRKRERQSHIPMKEGEKGKKREGSRKNFAQLLSVRGK